VEGNREREVKCKCHSKIEVEGYYEEEGIAMVVEVQRRKNGTHSRSLVVGRLVGCLLVGSKTYCMSMIDGGELTVSGPQLDALDNDIDTEEGGFTTS